MPYVREKKIPGKNGKVYTYYQLVEGRRVNGKVRQKVIAHLGKHDSIESARAVAAKVVPNKADEPDNLEKLREINAEYLTHFLAYLRLAQHHDIRGELRALKGVRSRDATRQRTLLKARRARITALSDKADATKLRAEQIFDALSPTEQEQTRALSLAVVNHIEYSRERVQRMPYLF